MRCHLPFADDDPMLPATTTERQPGPWLLPPCVVAVLVLLMLAAGVALWRRAVGS